MKTVIFNNPGSDLFEKLGKIGLVNYDPKNRLKKQVIEGLSDNAFWGNSIDKGMDALDYFNKYYDEGKGWKSATIDLSDEGISRLNGSGIEFDVV